MQPLCEPYNGNLHDVHLATCTRRPRSVEGPILSFFSSARNVPGRGGYRFFLNHSSLEMLVEMSVAFHFFFNEKNAR